jgi:hypothetical protein
MIRRLSLVTFTVVALLIGFAAGYFLFLPLLKLSFAGWFNASFASSAEESGAATLRFGLALSTLAVMVPISALVTERFAVRAKYSHALAKSLLAGALMFGIALVYHHENLASRERIEGKLPQMFGVTANRLGDNPLTKIIWFTAVSLVIFGPLDLWIARQQKQWRATPAPAAEPEKRT